MKVKESLCNIFKEEVVEEVLKENEEIKFIEEMNRPNDSPYSRYKILDKEGVLFDIMIPDPRRVEEAKDIYLKYQNSIRMFMMDLFDVFVGEKEDINPYFEKSSKKIFSFAESTYEDGTPIVLINIPDSNLSKRIFGAVTFSSQEKNLRIAEYFVKFLEGEPIELSWREICEQ